MSSIGSTSMVQSPDPDGPPHGLCWKQKPRLHTWPERYVRLDGHSLHFFRARSAAVAATTRPESSSIDDVRGCTVEGGWEDWGLQQLPRVVLCRSDLNRGKALKLCFAAEQQRDAFLYALINVVAGRQWNATTVGAASMGLAPPQEEVGRQFDLQVVDSTDICPQNTRVKVLAADLHELYAAVRQALRPDTTDAASTTTPIRIEVMDTDFKDWIGPLTLADVLNVATIRVMTDDAGAELAHIERHQQVLQRHRAVLQTHQRQELMQQHPEQQLQQRYQHARREPQLQDIRQMSAMVGLRMM